MKKISNSYCNFTSVGSGILVHLQHWNSTFSIALRQGPAQAVQPHDHAGRGLIHIIHKYFSQGGIVEHEPVNLIDDHMGKGMTSKSHFHAGRNDQMRITILSLSERNRSREEQNE